MKLTAIDWICILLFVLTCFVGGIFYVLYRSLLNKQEHYQQTNETVKLISKCNSCMRYVQDWWNVNIMTPYQEKKMTDQQVQEAYNEMSETLIWLVAPCIVGWWNDSPTMLIQQARGLPGLKNVNVQVKTWWYNNVFMPNHFNDEQFGQVRAYLLDQFNACVDASATASTTTVTKTTTA